MVTDPTLRARQTKYALGRRGQVPAARITNQRLCHSLSVCLPDCMFSHPAKTPCASWPSLAATVTRSTATGRKNSSSTARDNLSRSELRLSSLSPCEIASRAIFGFFILMQCSAMLTYASTRCLTGLSIGNPGESQDTGLRSTAGEFDLS